MISLLYYIYLQLDQTKFNEDITSKTKLIKAALTTSFTSLTIIIFQIFHIRYNNKKYYEHIAIVNTILFSFFNIFISGFLRTYLFSTSDPLIFIILIDTTIRYLIVTFYYQSMKVTMISSIITICLLTISMYFVREIIPISLVYYGLLKILLLTLLIKYSNIFEKEKRNESNYKTYIEKERSYYINILDKLNIGFFISKQKKIIRYNKNLIESVKTSGLYSTNMILDIGKDKSFIKKRPDNNNFIIKLIKFIIKIIYSEEQTNNVEEDNYNNLCLEQEKSK